MFQPTVVISGDLRSADTLLGFSPLEFGSSLRRRSLECSSLGIVYVCVCFFNHP